MLANPTEFITFSNIINVMGPTVIFKSLFTSFNVTQRKAFLTDYLLTITVFWDVMLRHWVSRFRRFDGMRHVYP